MQNAPVADSFTDNRSKHLRSRLAKLQNRFPKRRTEISSLNSANALRDSQQSATRYLSLAEIWNFFSDICNGLAHLHNHGIIHRDLKPQNLLLQHPSSDSNGVHTGRPKLLLTDFGECEVISHLEKRERTGATGTLEFMAPELLRGK